jgi:hypothetical protein
MLAIANVAAENTRTAFPTYQVAGTPSRAYRGWPGSCAQLVALACLPRLASRQSLFAGQGRVPNLSRRRIPQRWSTYQEGLVVSGFVIPSPIAMMDRLFVILMPR